VDIAHGETKALYFQKAQLAVHWKILQVHGAGDVVLVGGELDRVDRFEKGLAVRNRLHPGKGMLEKGAKLLKA